MQKEEPLGDSRQGQESIVGVESISVVLGFPVLEYLVSSESSLWSDEE